MTRFSIAKKVGKITLFALTTVTCLSGPACAAEPVVCVAKNTKEVSEASLALTAAVCATAGSVCTKAISKTSKNPKLIVPFGCVALISWCAAKTSPL